MKPLSYNKHEAIPNIGMKVYFVTYDNIFHEGTFGSNENFQNCFYDKRGKEYEKGEVKLWEEIKEER